MNLQWKVTESKKKLHYEDQVNALVSSGCDPACLCSLIRTVLLFGVYHRFTNYRPHTGLDTGHWQTTGLIDITQHCQDASLPISNTENRSFDWNKHKCLQSRIIENKSWRAELRSEIAGKSLRYQINQRSA